MARIWNKHKIPLDQTPGKNTPLKPKVFVGLSGGVDSSVAAYLLKKRGYDVTGIHLRCWNREGCDALEAEDARRVAEKLDIPFYVFNLEKEYREKVVQYMIEGYARGETPNPDVMCNKEIKFGLFLEKALKMGADYVATGHYVKLESRIENLEYGGRDKKFLNSKSYILYSARDKTKDQSYFLWTLTQKQLCHCLFPIGDYLKLEVRKIAKKAGLLTADKKDSQGICFLGKITLPEFLNEYLPAKRGNILDTSGKVLGKHKGAQFYTIGQRHLGIMNCERGAKGRSETKPFYVIEKNIKKNILTVAEGHDNPLSRKKEIELTDVNFINPFIASLISVGGGHARLPVFGGNGRINIYARVRYRQPLAPATLIYDSQSADLRGKNLRESSLQPANIRVIFDKPQKFIAKGQSAVFYMPAVALAKAGSKNIEMLGGGIIK